MTSPALSPTMRNALALLLSQPAPASAPSPNPDGTLPANHPILQQMADWPIEREPVSRAGGGQLMKLTGKIR